MSFAIDYQNIFTRIQVRGPDDTGPPIESQIYKRGTSIFHNYWLGKIGDAQIGPIYLGWYGSVSLLFGIIAFEIIGLNMWASVNWDPVQFVRQLFWLALEPPAPKYGLSIPPMAEGGWWTSAHRRSTGASSFTCPTTRRRVPCAAVTSRERPAFPGSARPTTTERSSQPTSFGPSTWKRSAWTQKKR